MSLGSRIRRAFAPPALFPPKWPWATVALDYPRSKYPWTAQSRINGATVLSVGETRADALERLVTKAAEVPPARVAAEVVNLAEGGPDA